MRVYNIPKPRSIHDDTKPFVHNTTMCGSCAYRTPLTDNELEYERDMMNLRPEKHHACHEKANSWCAGSVKTVNRICSSKDNTPYREEERK